MQEQMISEQQPVSFIAEKIKRMQPAAGSPEMMAMMRDYLANERNAHAVVIYENTANTARVIPFARMRALG
ncbi:MAG: hypothetical protein JST01_06785 [Cyanobacteria bacterium SZAS TMP-1]|nr:hypothetical protein [Cyanobacteria bacterium SZAS TMP-1]